MRRTIMVILFFSIHTMKVRSYLPFIELLRLHKYTIRCVFLNACYTNQLSMKIKEHIDCVIGSEGELGDEASEFSSTFYRFIVKDSTRGAFDKALNNLQLQNTQSNSHKIEFREGIDGSKMHLFAHSSTDIDEYLRDIIKSSREFLENAIDVIQLLRWFGGIWLKIQSCQNL
jgi:hypothetical protein